MKNIGALLRQERRKRNWSQQGLCQGICAVSYLSKIEQGKVTPSQDVLRPLFARLGLPLEDTDTDLSAAVALLAQMEEALILGNTTWLNQQEETFSTLLPLFERSTYAARAALLWQHLQPSGAPLPPEMECCLDDRSLALQRLLQQRFDEAIALWPHAYPHFYIGLDAYRHGAFSTALLHLEQAHTLAAEEDAVHLMFHCRVFLGNCYCQQLRLPEMRRQYALATRLGTLLGEKDTLRSLRYNVATTDMDVGDYATAYEFFSALKAPDAMSLHKLAVCCEKLGRPEDARQALVRAQAAPTTIPDRDLCNKICRIVSYRLEHPDYLRQEDYGTLLLSTFRQMQQELPVGFAQFHLPWVLEWYTANRHYKDALEFLQSFPELLAKS